MPHTSSPASSRPSVALSSAVAVFGHSPSPRERKNPEKTCGGTISDRQDLANFFPSVSPTGQVSRPKLRPSVSTCLPWPPETRWREDGHLALSPLSGGAQLRRHFLGCVSGGTIWMAEVFNFFCRVCVCVCVCILLLELGLRPVFFEIVYTLCRATWHDSSSH